MPRYFFDYSDDGKVTQDEEGLDLPDLERAKYEAIAALPGLARDSEIHAASRIVPWEVASMIRTETGQTVFRATLSLQARDLP